MELETSNDTSKLMNTHQACEYLGLSQITMYRLIKSMQIDHIKIGQGRGTYRFRKDALDAYINKHRVRVDS